MNVTRNTYFKRLQDLSEIDRRVMFVSADCAGLVFEEYRRTHPESFVNVGIAEQNMIAVSCGLALAGKRPVAYGHAPFATVRDDGTANQHSCQWDRFCPAVLRRNPL